MRGKKKVLIGAGIILAGIIAYGFSVTTSEESIEIKASLFDVASHITDSSKWKRWCAGEHAPSAYLIHKINPAAAELADSAAPDQPVAYVGCYPGKAIGYTSVLWRSENSRWKYLYQKVTGRSANHDALEKLKKFLENDTVRYGFFIDLVPVTDTLILTHKKKVTTGEQQQAVKQLLTEALAYITAKGVARTGKYYYVSSLDIDAQTKEVAVGFPVAANQPSSKEYELLQLPANGRLVKGVVSPDGTPLSKLYEAIDHYIMDKQLKKVAQPLEKYNDGDDRPDEIYYPVY